ncbi:MAG: hypothetical protein AB1689_09010 [Thermodesulfobacteriota bacterium]
MHYSSAREAVKVDQLALVLGILSGLRFVAPHLDAAATVVTALAMHVTYAVLCWIFASQHRRNGAAWSIAGLLGGAVTTIVLLVANERQASRDEPPAP